SSDMDQFDYFPATYLILSKRISRRKICLYYFNPSETKWIKEHGKNPITGEKIMDSPYYWSTLDHYKSLFYKLTTITRFINNHFKLSPESYSSKMTMLKKALSTVEE